MSFTAGVWYGTLVILTLLPYTIRIIVQSEAKLQGQGSAKLSLKPLHVEQPS